MKYIEDYNYIMNNNKRLKNKTSERQLINIDGYDYKIKFINNVNIPQEIIPDIPNKIFSNNRSFGNLNKDKISQYQFYDKNGDMITIDLIGVYKYNNDTTSKFQHINADMYKVLISGFSKIPKEDILANQKEEILKRLKNIPENFQKFFNVNGLFEKKGDFFINFPILTKKGWYIHNTGEYINDENFVIIIKNKTNKSIVKKDIYFTFNKNEFNKITFKEEQKTIENGKYLKHDLVGKFLYEDKFNKKKFEINKNLLISERIFYYKGIFKKSLKNISESFSKIEEIFSKKYLVKGFDIEKYKNQNSLYINNNYHQYEKIEEIDNLGKKDYIFYFKNNKQLFSQKSELFSFKESYIKGKFIQTSFNEIIDVNEKIIKNFSNKNINAILIKNGLNIIKDNKIKLIEERKTCQKIDFKNSLFFQNQNTQSLILQTENRIHYLDKSLQHFSKSRNNKIIIYFKENEINETEKSLKIKIEKDENINKYNNSLNIKDNTFTDHRTFSDNIVNNVIKKNFIIKNKIKNGENITEFYYSLKNDIENRHIIPIENFKEFDDVKDVTANMEVFKNYIYSSYKSPSLKHKIIFSKNDKFIEIKNNNFRKKPIDIFIGENITFFIFNNNIKIIYNRDSSIIEEIPFNLSKTKKLEKNIFNGGTNIDINLNNKGKTTIDFQKIDKICERKIKSLKIDKDKEIDKLLKEKIDNKIKKVLKTIEMNEFIKIEFKDKNIFNDKNFDLL